MKRFLCAAAFVLMSLCFADKLSAGNFGIIGGANFSTMKIKEVSTQTMTQWHAGLAYKMNLPLGFHLQPTLLYNVKGANGTKFSDVDLSVGYLELMASVQWGVDLILFRPFLDVSPFIGYGVNGWGSLKEMWKGGANKFEYGVGLGGGLDVWRFQISARYNWNFGSLMKDNLVKESIGNANFSGVTLSLAYFF